MNERVLVIDDEPVMRAFMSEALRRAGYDVYEAEDGDEGLERLQLTPCDLVVTDLLMPNREGIEFCAALHDNYPGLRVVAVSGATSAEVYFGILRHMGVRAALQKPFTDATLRDVVRSVLDGAELPALR